MHFLGLAGRFVLLAGAVLGGACTTAPPLPEPEPSPQPKPRPEVVSAWVELGPGRELLVRAVVKGLECPELRVTEPKVSSSGMSVGMQSRGVPSEAFPQTVCEVTLQSSVTKIELGDLKLPVLPRAVNKIVLVGDTGCRIKRLTRPGEEPAEFGVQDCSRKWGWPEVARRIAAENPDLVIHVGDYLYREAACPEGKPGCADSPHGDNWAAWRADFFDPAQPALRTAPWIFVRGNHELCSRGGQGWFRLLDPRPLRLDCQDTTAGYVIPKADGGPEFLVLDAAEEGHVERDLQALLQQPGMHVGARRWLLAHRPFARITQAKLSASGHFHLLAFTRFPGWRAPQIVAGNGGTHLDKTVHSLFSSKGAVSRSAIAYGYAVLEQSSKPRLWSLSARSRKGKTIFRCDLDESQPGPARLDCPPASPAATQSR